MKELVKKLKKNSKKLNYLYTEKNDNLEIYKNVIS